MSYHPQDNTIRCGNCGAWKWNDRPCPDCEHHRKTWWENTSTDTLYAVCGLCGRDWPCPGHQARTPKDTP